MHRFGVAKRYGKDFNALMENLSDQSIDSYEIGFSYGIPDTFFNSSIDSINKFGIKISAHLPFYISWKNEEKTRNSVNQLSRGFKFSSKYNTISVFHLGFYGNKSFKELKPIIVSSILESFELASSYSKMNRAGLGIETTGRQAEIGTLEEVLEICSSLPQNVAIPVIDWAHIWARSNGNFLKKREDFENVITKIENHFAIKDFYFHGSGVEFKEGNEIRHLSVQTCLPPLPFLLDVLKENGYNYTMIVESPNPINDAIWLKQVSLNPKLWFSHAQKQLNENINKQRNLFDFF